MIDSKNRIARQRFINTGLAKPELKTASEVVSMLGAVQAQDYAGAKWGVAQRATGLNDARIEKEIDEGSIVRTHVLRPTWHFVVAADIGWILALTGPRVHAANAYWYRWLEIDDAVARRSRTALAKALRDRKHLTRAELGKVLSRANIPRPTSQRLAAIVMRAELDGLICSGPRRGNQFTYALLEDRIAKATRLDREASLGELAHRYFTTRGPATVNDFAWWSGLTVADAKKSVEMNAPKLEHESIDGRTYWYTAAQPPRRMAGALAHPLPNYDEYFIGLKDRSAFGARLESAGVIPRTGALSGHILTINGQIVGGWKRTVAKGKIVLDPNLLVRLTDAERRAVESAAKRYSRFLSLPVEIRWR